MGLVGSTLGGGYGRLMGLYGYGIDNMLSANLITAAGETMTVDAGNEELWWALRGAGPNFGIVTSITMKTYPVPRERNGAWLGTLVFTEDKIEALVQAIDELEMKPQMAVFMYFVTTGPPDFIPSVIAFPFYAGIEEEGRAAFALILALGPVADETAWTSYDKVNSGSAPFCVKRGRKPSYGAGLPKIDALSFRQVWDLFVKWLEDAGTGASAVLFERYDLSKAKEIGDGSSSYPWRSTFKYIAVAIPWYDNAFLDEKAEAFGSAVRDIWRSDENEGIDAT